MVAAPLQDVHRHPRRVGELEEEELLAGIVRDPGRIRAAREDVEAVQADAERRMVGALDDPPGVLVVVDVAAPRQRLVGDPQPARGGPLGQLAQLRGGQRVVVDRRPATTFEHTSSSSAPSSCISANFASARREVRRSGTPSKSRNGW